MDKAFLIERFGMGALPDVVGWLPLATNISVAAQPTFVSCTLEHP